MESKQKPSHPSDYDSDKDISYLLYKTAQAIKRGLTGIGSVFVAIGMAIRTFLYFLAKNVVWLLIGTTFGLVFGIYKYIKAGPQFSSEMIVQANFNSTRPLYNTISHLNTLIGTSSRDELSRIFKISKEEAAQLKTFNIEPVKDELIIADMYRRKFLLDPIDKHDIRQDTFWTRTIPYGEFKESLTMYDYPVHTITAISYNQGIFAKLQNGISDGLLNSQLADKYKEAEAANNHDDIKILGSAIEGLDTLRRTYNEKMLKGENIPQVIEQKPGLSPNNLTFVAPELELYDRLIVLKEELKNARRRSVLENNVLEVQSAFTSPGKRVSLLEEDIFPPAIVGFLLVLCILLLVEIFRLFLAFKVSR